MSNRLAPDPSCSRCVYTILLGGYELLNEQPIASESSIPFICFTDDPTLKSESWEIRLVSPVFAMDSIRSQRDLKIRPYVHLPEFAESLYIDNTVLLTARPELLFDNSFTKSGLKLPLHSFRETVVDEFLAVAESGFDDQSRIFEQLNHYQVECPEVLSERPYWTAILLRDHADLQVQAAMETWYAHVLRYSRRDQLSVNLALHYHNLSPEVWEIDNLNSTIHHWPSAHGRDRDKGTRSPLRSFSPPIAQVRLLKREIEELKIEIEGLKAENIRAQNQSKIKEGQGIDCRIRCNSGVQDVPDSIENEFPSEECAALVQVKSEYKISTAELMNQIVRMETTIRNVQKEHEVQIAHLRNQHSADMAHELALSSAQILSIEGQRSIFEEKTRRLDTQLSQAAHEVERLCNEIQKIQCARGYRIAKFFSKGAAIFPRTAWFTWQALRLGWWICTLQAHRRIPESLKNRRLNKLKERAGALTELSSIADIAVNENAVIYVDPSDKRGEQLIASGGDFNPNSLRMWKKLVGAGSWNIVVDVGANYGEMLVNLKFERATTLIAIEPNPVILPFLRKTLNASDISCTILPCAVSDFLGYTQLRIDRQWSGTTRIAADTDENDSGRYQLVEVPCTTLTQVVRTHANILPRRVLLKIDVEGQEVPVLRGIADILDDFEAFAALVEVIHLNASDLNWILSNFNVYLLDTQTDALIQVSLSDAESFLSFVKSGSYYQQDVCITRKMDADVFQPHL